VNQFDKKVKSSRPISIDFAKNESIKLLDIVDIEVDPVPEKHDKVAYKEHK
tara:strand:+ start:214 stop:366 length:153 start_codon:yes stop_codon:yes gene_type:complete